MTLRIIIAVGVLAVANIIGGFLPSVFLLIPGALDLLSGSSPWGFAAAFVQQALVLAFVIFAVWAWMRWVERRSLRDAGWRWGRRSVLWLLLGIVIAATSLLAVTIVLPATGSVPDSPAMFGEPGAAPLTIALLIVYYVGLAFLQQSIPEELLFRGWLLWRLRHRPVVAVVVTALAFTVIHLVSSGGQQSAWEHVLYLALPFGFAVLATGMLLWTGSLWAAVGVHGGFHIGNYIAASVLAPVDAATSWLAVGGVQTAIGLVLVVTALRRGRTILDARD